MGKNHFESDVEFEQYLLSQASVPMPINIDITDIVNRKRKRIIKKKTLIGVGALITCLLVGLSPAMANTIIPAITFTFERITGNSGTLGEVSFPGSNGPFAGQPTWSNSGQSYVNVQDDGQQINYPKLSQFRVNLDTFYAGVYPHNQIIIQESGEVPGAKLPTDISVMMLKNYQSKLLISGRSVNPNHLVKDITIGSQPAEFIQMNSMSFIIWKLNNWTIVLNAQNASGQFTKELAKQFNSTALKNLRT